MVTLCSLGEVVHDTRCLKAISTHLTKAENPMVVERPWAAVVRHDHNVDTLIESNGHCLNCFQDSAPFHDKPFDIAIDIDSVNVVLDSSLEIELTSGDQNTRPVSS